MRRISYIGDKPAAGGGIPTQQETASYLARMSTPPSLAWQTALNTAIYNWKSDGVWGQIIELWLHCAETQQAALLGLKGLVDAALTGSPTFTATKGFSGFDGTSKVLTWPISSAQLANDAVKTVACIGLSSGFMNTGLIVSPSGLTGGTPGNFQSDNNGRLAVNTSNMSVDASNRPALIGGGGTNYYLAGTAGNLGGGFGPRSHDYFTANIAAPHPLTTVRMYGFVSSTATTTQMRKFMNTSSQFLETIGALD